MPDVPTQHWRRRDATRRHLMPGCGFSTLALILAAMSSAGCTYKPTVRPSQGHINASNSRPRPPTKKILPPVTVSEFVPPPQAAGQGSHFTAW